MRKWFFTVLVLAAAGGAILGLAIVFEGQGVLVVSETITVPAPNLNVSLEPNLTVTQTFTIDNSGAMPVNVIVLVEVFSDDPPGPYAGVTVETPLNPVAVPAGGSVGVLVLVVANNGVVPGTGVVTMSVHRPELGP